MVKHLAALLRELQSVPVKREPAYMPNRPRQWRET